MDASPRRDTFRRAFGRVPVADRPTDVLRDRNRWNSARPSTQPYLRDTGLNCWRDLFMLEWLFPGTAGDVISRRFWPTVLFIGYDLPGCGRTDVDGHARLTGALTVSHVSTGWDCYS